VFTRSDDFSPVTTGARGWARGAMAVAGVSNSACGGGSVALAAPVVPPAELWDGPALTSRTLLQGPTAVYR
jgi:hypothetical protein